MAIMVRQPAAGSSDPALAFRQPKTVQEAIEIFLCDANAGQKLGADTLLKKRNVLKALEAFCDEKGKTYLQKISFEDLTEVRATWKDQALSASKKLERLKGFFGFCFTARRIETNPAAKLKRPKVILVATLPFTREQMAQWGSRRILTSVAVAASASYISSRPISGLPTSRISLMTSVACSRPMVPGSTPSTPLAPHEGASSAGGGTGKRQR